MTKLLRIGLVLLAASAAGAWSLDVPARLGWSHRGDRPLTLYGNVDIRQVQLGFRVSGRIARMELEEGDRVAAGTLLASLDTQPYQEAVAAAQAQVARETANLAKLRAGPRAAEIAQARAAVAERDADLANVTQAFERARQLRPGGTISQASFDQAQAGKDMATARLASAREALRLLEEGTRAEDIAVGCAALEAAQANLAAAQTSLQDANLLAPDDGVILSRVREPGAIVGPSDTVYVLSLDRSAWVRAYVPESSLGRIHPGLAVEIVTDSAPSHPYRGQVGFVSPVAEFTPKTVETPELRTDLVYRLRITINQPDGGLRQGMPVTVRIPNAALTSGGES